MSASGELGLTWIFGTTIGAFVVSRDRLYKVLKGTLVASLLPLAYGSHGVRGPVLGSQIGQSKQHLEGKQKGEDQSLHKGSSVSVELW